MPVPLDPWVFISTQCKHKLCCSVKSDLPQGLRGRGREGVLARGCGERPAAAEPRGAPGRRSAWGSLPPSTPAPPRGLVPSLKKKCACDTRTQGSWRAGSILGGPDSPGGVHLRGMKFCWEWDPSLRGQDSPGGGTHLRGTGFTWTFGGRCSSASPVSLILAFRLSLRISVQRCAPPPSVSRLLPPPTLAGWCCSALSGHLFAVCSDESE